MFTVIFSFFSQKIQQKFVFLVHPSHPTGRLVIVVRIVIESIWQNEAYGVIQNSANRHQNPIYLIKQCLIFSSQQLSNYVTLINNTHSPHNKINNVVDFIIIRSNPACLYAAH